jgi:hypothetical protein
MYMHAQYISIKSVYTESERASERERDAYVHPKKIDRDMATVVVCLICLLCVSVLILIYVRWRIAPLALPLDAPQLLYTSSLRPRTLVA